MCAFTFLRSITCPDARTHPHAHTHTHTRMHTRTHTHTHTRKYTKTHPPGGAREGLEELEGGTSGGALGRNILVPPSVVPVLRRAWAAGGPWLEPGSRDSQSIRLLFELLNKAQWPLPWCLFFNMHGQREGHGWNLAAETDSPFTFYFYSSY